MKHDGRDMVAVVAVAVAGGRRKPTPTLSLWTVVFPSRSPCAGGLSLVYESELCRGRAER